VPESVPEPADIRDWQNKAEKEPDNKRKNIVIAGIIAGIIAVGIVCGLIFFFHPEDNSEKTTAIIAPVVANENSNKEVTEMPVTVNGVKYTYSGSVNADYMPEGIGKATFNSGLWTEYEGEFHEGMRHGKGKLTYRNGDSYEGEFENDMYSNGTYRTAPDADGSYDYFTGSFTNGTPYNGTWYHSDGNVYQRVVNGAIK